MKHAFKILAATTMLCLWCSGAETILVPAINGEWMSFHLSYTSQQSVLVRTSANLKDWSEPTTIYSLPAGEGGGPESPTILKLHGGFYLLWCRWDPKLSKKGFTYQDRSFVFFSNTPMDFTNRQPVAEIQSHAPELFQDEDGDWWISSAERPNRGVSIAPVKWQPMISHADVQSPATLPALPGADDRSESKPR